MGSVGAEYTVSGTSWSVLTLEAGKSPTNGGGRIISPKVKSTHPLPILRGAARELERWATSPEYARLLARGMHAAPCRAQRGRAQGPGLESGLCAWTVLCYRVKCVNSR